MPEGLLSAIHFVLQTREVKIARLNATYPKTRCAAIQQHHSASRRELAPLRHADCVERKDRHVMLPAEVLELLRQWWKARSWAPAGSECYGDLMLAPISMMGGARSSFGRLSLPPSSTRQTKRPLAGP